MLSSAKVFQKEVGTNFPLLSRSRDMIGWFMKTYLHQPIKILQFLWENSKMLNKTAKYFSILNNKPPASWVAHITRDFLTCYSCSYYSSMLWYNTIFQINKILCLNNTFFNIKYLLWNIMLSLKYDTFFSVIVTFILVFSYSTFAFS